MHLHFKPVNLTRTFNDQLPWSWPSNWKSTVRSRSLGPTYSTDWIGLWNRSPNLNRPDHNRRSSNSTVWINLKVSWSWLSVQLKINGHAEIVGPHKFNGLDCFRGQEQICRSQPSDWRRTIQRSEWCHWRFRSRPFNRN